MRVNKVCNRANLDSKVFDKQNEMTPRNNMETADPQAPDPFEATSGHGAFVEGYESSATHSASPAQRSRRSVRIAVLLPVVVRDQFGGREETRTQFVMVRGAILATTSNVRVGHKLTVQIVKSGRAAECTVTAVEPVLKDVHSVEVEFTREQPDFWPVQFPPEDLKTDSGSYRFSASAAPATLGSQSSGFTEAPKHETTEPSGISHSNSDLVSLADSITGDSFNGSSFGKAEKFAPRSPSVDSVAQFRAANRAAHRREQRTKALYSVLSLAVLAAAILGARYWMQHRPEIGLVSLPSIPQVLPKPKPSEKPIRTSSNDQTSAPVIATPPAPSLTEIPHAAPMAADPGTATLPIAPEIKPTETQVAVRHRAPLASSRKTSADDIGEEPLALPLRASTSTSATEKAELLNQVVAQAPMKAALLAPQPVRQAVPAKLVYSAPAQYPSMARQIHVEGEVIISLDVDTSGNVSAARAVSGPPILRAAALDAVKSWRYQPAKLGDMPVVSTEVVKVQFRLR